MHNTCTTHEERDPDAVYWVDINLAIRKGLTFYQTRTNAIILQGILPPYCIPKVVRLKTGEVLYEKFTYHLDLHQRSRYVTIGLQNWVLQMINNQKKKLLDKQNFFQPTQPTPNLSCDRSGQPDITHDVRVFQIKEKRPLLLPRSP